MYRSPRLVVLIVSACCSYGARAATDGGPKKIETSQLFQIVAAAQSTPDAELAQKLTGMVLTDRLSGDRLTELMSKLPGDKSRMAVTLLADQSIFLAPPDELPALSPPNAAAAQQMLVRVVNYVNTTVRQLPNLMAMRSTEGFEDRPREDKLTSTGMESLECLPLHWVGSVRTEVTYRDRQEVEDRSVKAEKKGNGVGGMITSGEFGPVLSTVLADALKGKIAWTRWEKAGDGTMAVFHYQIPENKSNYHVQFCCIVSGYRADGSAETEVFDERSAYHGDIVFNAADGSIRLLTLEADVPTGALVSGAGIAIEYAATEIGAHSYICPIKSVSILQAHTAQQSGAFSRSDYKGPAKTFLNDVTFSNYRRFGSEVKIVSSAPLN